ncbi:MAG: serine/threonine-protein kinase [Candidatus Electryonea clarkiae]|nr:serine/threonine-protein kinase [Candidatus Electryonea clarkiae]MDP8288583.1 serine/threonine-protein kinase [Candidatus Electryonea clarkiae]
MNYEFVKHRGTGGFGKVEEVKDENSNPFARKTFSINQPQPLSSEMQDNVKKRFIREAKTQFGIRHVNIVPVLSHNLDENPPYFIMPLAIKSLEEDITKNKNLDGKYLRALMDIISGLEEIHSLAIYHRDLKPANVLRFQSDSDLEGSEDYYAIGDFGLISLKETQFSELTKAGMRMGSDFYTAPEIVQDLRKASIQSDIFSLGCIIHDFIGTEQRIPMHEIREDGPYGGILLNCTRNDPSRRFKSVASVRDAILSLGKIEVEAKTNQGGEIIALLVSEDQLTGEEWNRVTYFIDDEYDSEDCTNALYKLTLKRIDEVTTEYPELGRILGIRYAYWVREETFLFEHCDAIAMRLKRFIENCTLDVQCECLMAMLYMGVSHNRWYVERMFGNLTDDDMDINLARRLAVEFRAEGYELCYKIAHWERSINWNRSSLHTILSNALEDICTND